MKAQVHIPQNIKDSCGATLLVIIYICSKNLEKAIDICIMRTITYGTY